MPEQRRCGGGGQLPACTMAPGGSWVEWSPCPGCPDCEDEQRVPSATRAAHRAIVARLRDLGSGRRGFKRKRFGSAVLDYDAPYVYHLTSGDLKVLNRAAELLQRELNTDVSAAAIPTFRKDSVNGMVVCDACGCELGSAPVPGRKFAGHTDDCAFMLALHPDPASREEGSPDG